MVTATPEVQSLSERQKILNEIPGKELGYLIKTRKNIKKDLIMGFIGERGGGKSGSAAVEAIVDFGMEGIPIFSNMKISCDIEISDETARKYGLSHGGVARYRSLPLDLPRLLRFDEIFRGSLIFIDEINIEVSEARRSQTNTNLFSNRLAQELRHLEAGMLFTCISEMAIDNRIRDIVDSFTKSEETAYYEENIRVGKPIGVDFKWSTYLMNRCFNGHTYAETHRPEKDVIFHFKPWRGIYDDKEFQGQGMTKYGVNMKDFNEEDMAMSLQTSESPKVAQHDREWGWFGPLLVKMFESGRTYYPANEIWNDPEVKRHRIAPGKMSRYLLDAHGIPTVRDSFNGGRKQTYYVLPDEGKSVLHE